MKLQQHKGLKLNKMIFGEKFVFKFFEQKGRKMGPNEVFKFCEKSMH